MKTILRASTIAVAFSVAVGFSFAMAFALPANALVAHCDHFEMILMEVDNDKNIVVLEQGNGYMLVKDKKTGQKWLIEMDGEEGCIRKAK